MPVMDRYLRDNDKEIKINILKNLHIFLQQVDAPQRLPYIDLIMQTQEKYKKDWRIKNLLALNLGKFASLFDADIVYNQIMPLFFNFTQQPICEV